MNCFIRLSFASLAVTSSLAACHYQAAEEREVEVIERQLSSPSCIGPDLQHWARFYSRDDKTQRMRFYAIKHKAFPAGVELSSRQVIPHLEDDVPFVAGEISSDGSLRAFCSGVNSRPCCTPGR